MLNLEISKPYIRLKHIREYFKITQSEVAGNGITRNSISQIENGKQRFTSKAAEIIAENINEVLEKKGLDVRFTKEKLLETIEEQANNKIICKIEISKTLNIKERLDKIKEIKSLLKEYAGLICYKVRIESYKCFIDYYYDIDNKINALAYSEKAYEEAMIENDTNDKSHFLLEKAILKIDRELYKEAISDLDYLEIIGIEKHLKLIKYNKAIAFKRNDKFEEAIDILQYIENRNMNENILLANCYVETKRFNQAEKLYDTCLMQCIEKDDSVYLCQIYRNLSEVYLKQDNYSKAKELIDLRLSKYSVCNYNLSEHTNYASEVYINIDIDQALKLAERALKIERTKKKPIKSMISKIHVQILEVLLATDNSNTVKEHIESCINENVDISKLGCTIIDFFMEKEEYCFVKKFNSYFKKLNDEK